MAKKKKVGDEIIVCSSVRELPQEQWIEAADMARDINPVNAPMMAVSFDGEPLDPGAIAAYTSRYWGSGGVDLTVGFPFDNPSQALRAKVISHCNAWGANGRANIRFRESNTSPDLRIAFDPNGGHYSYLGTDARMIPRNQPTMNLAINDRTPDSEFYRVVRHEAGHALGFPHEHLRKELVARIDPAKAIAYFERNHRWSEATTRSNVLTPIPDNLLILSPIDQTSIMAYQLPASIMRDGKPIIGGNDINQSDYDFVARIYPPLIAPPPPPPPPEGMLPSVLIAVDAAGKEVARYRLQMPSSLV